MDIVHCQSREFLQHVFWLIFHNDTTENIYLKAKSSKIGILLLLTRIFPPTLLYDKDWLFNFINTPKKKKNKKKTHTSFTVIALTLMPFALFGYFHTLSEHNLYAVEKLSVMFKKSLLESLCKPHFPNATLKCLEILLYSTIPYYALTYTSITWLKRRKLKRSKLFKEGGRNPTIFSLAHSP